ncbi:MAG TPA: endospore germination permease [Clostridiaceae bacterium]|nr:endospore germination permease [Clostridiaceae bacterium]
MKSKIAFGVWEAVTIMVILFCTQVFLDFPRTMVENAGNAGWILVIYVTIIVLLLFAIMSKLYSRFEGMDILDISEYLAGNVGRIIAGMVFLVYFVFILSVVLREYAENVKTVSLPTTPIVYIMCFFAISMIVGAYAGIEALVRTSAVSVPVIIVAYISILLGVSQYFDITNLFPILGTGAKDIFINGIPKISFFSAISVLFFIAPFVKTYKNFKSVGYISIIIAGIGLTLSSLVYMLVFPYPASLENVLPLYTLARLINYGRFFQRIETIFVVIWDTVAMLYLSTVLFLTVYVFKKTFKLVYYKPLIIPFTLIIVTVSLIPQSYMSVVELENRYFRRIIWTVSFAFITLIMLAAILFKKRRKRRS